MVCGMPFLEASCQTPPIGWVYVSYPKKGMTVTVTLYQYTMTILKILATNLWWHGHDLKTMHFQHGGTISNCTKLNTCSAANVILWSGDIQWPAWNLD
jgi:hypothetical protein